MPAASSSSELDRPQPVSRREQRSRAGRAPAPPYDAVVRLWAERHPLIVPAEVRAACAELPEFERMLRLVGLARWWNVWIGGGAGVVAIAVLCLTMLALAEQPGPHALKRWLLLAGAALLVLAGGLAWGIGRRLPRLAAQRPRALRGALAMAAVANALLVAPMALFLFMLMLADAGVVPGGVPGFGILELVVTFAGLATPAVGVFANGYPWLRLGRAFDAAVADLAR